jgi:hypothetical protein
VRPTLESLGVGEPTLIDVETLPSNSRMAGSN